MFDCLEFVANETNPKHVFRLPPPYRGLNPTLCKVSPFRNSRNTLTLPSSKLFQLRRLSRAKQTRNQNHDCSASSKPNYCKMMLFTQLDTTREASYLIWKER